LLVAFYLTLIENKVKKQIIALQDARL